MGILRRRRTPQAATAAEVVELVEQRHAQRLRQLRALQHRLLPGLDLLTPPLPIAQSFRSNRRGLITTGAEEIGVAAQGLTAGGKGRHRQIPADHHRNLDALARR